MTKAIYRISSTKRRETTETKMFYHGKAIKIADFTESTANSPMVKITLEDGTEGWVFSDQIKKR